VKPDVKMETNKNSDEDEVDRPKFTFVAKKNRVTTKKEVKTEKKLSLGNFNVILKVA
jgi:hypothetical protein